MLEIIPNSMRIVWHCTIAVFIFRLLDFPNYRVPRWAFIHIALTRHFDQVNHGLLIPIYILTNSQKEQGSSISRLYSNSTVTLHLICSWVQPHVLYDKLSVITNNPSAWYNKSTDTTWMIMYITQPWLGAKFFSLPEKWVSSKGQRIEAGMYD